MPENKQADLQEVAVETLKLSLSVSAPKVLSGEEQPTKEQIGFCAGICDAITQLSGLSDDECLDFSFKVFQEVLGPKGGSLFLNVVQNQSEYLASIKAGGDAWLRYWEGPKDRSNFPFLPPSPDSAVPNPADNDKLDIQRTQKRHFPTIEHAKNFAVKILLTGLDLTAPKGIFGGLKPTHDQIGYCFGFCDAVVLNSDMSDAYQKTFPKLVFGHIFGPMKGHRYVDDIIENIDSYLLAIKAGQIGFEKFLTESKYTPIPPLSSDHLTMQNVYDDSWHKT